MESIHTEITIDAPAAVVWALLTDLGGYRRWNPFVVEAAGTIALGERLHCQPILPGSTRRNSFRPVVNMCRPGTAFSWVGHVGAPWIVAGEHIFELTSLGATRVHLVHRERFTGLLSPLMRGPLVAATRRGFELMNEAVKRAAESAFAAGA